MNYRFFTPAEVQDLIKKDLIYKPEYALPTIEDWLNGHSYPLEVIKRWKKMYIEFDGSNYRTSP
jgi:hypothetical protein